MATLINLTEYADIVPDNTKMLIHREGNTSAETINYGVMRGLTIFTSDDSINQGDVVSLKSNGNITPVIDTTTADNWVGIAQNTVTGIGIVSVAGKGMIDQNQTGLIPGTIYYLNDDGSLTSSNNGRKLGRALSITDIILVY